MRNIKQLIYKIHASLFNEFNNIYGKSHCCLTKSMLSVLYTLKKFCKLSNSLTELLVNGMTSIAYKNGSHYDLNSCTETNSKLAPFDL